MYLTIKIKKIAAISFTLMLLLAVVFISLMAGAQSNSDNTENTEFITWVDFDVPSSLLQKAMEVDIVSYDRGDDPHISWVELIAYLGTKYGGDFAKHNNKKLTELVEKLEAGETIAALTKDLKNYDYYYEAYDAVLGGFVGEYEVQTSAGKWEKRYGLKAFSPIAKTFPYDDYDDFGTSRDYGYKRRHLGHDMMAATGTPVIAVESGVIEVMGWNQYGGWRIGIRSFDGKRYHYYAHLRQNRPYAEGLAEGQTVMAGDVIGYVGRTGYSTTENTNNIKVSHLHYGLQLIFDESQKEGASEIWIDLYDICNFLRQNQSDTIRDEDTKERTRAQNYRETIPEDCFVPSPVKPEETVP